MQFTTACQLNFFLINRDTPTYCCLESGWYLSHSVWSEGRESRLCKCSILIILGGRPYSLPNKNGPGLTPGYKHRKDSKVVIANRQKKSQPASSRDAMTSSKVELPGELKNDPAALMASLHLVPSPVPNPEIKYTKVRETFYNFFQES